jgi:hypothetical protein
VPLPALSRRLIPAAGEGEAGYYWSPNWAFRQSIPRISIVLGYAADRNFSSLATPMKVAELRGVPLSF